MAESYRMNDGRERFAMDHVALAMPAGQEEIARAFYAGALGFAEIPKPEELAARGGVWFRSGSAVIHLAVDPAFAPAKKAHPALRCFDYDALLKRLESNGTSTLPDPMPFEGKEHCYVADPFGNRVELIAEPSEGSSR